jgi:hypothetical protein
MRPVTAIVAGAPAILAFGVKAPATIKTAAMPNKLVLFM